MKTYVSIYYGFDFETPLYQFDNGNEANRFIKGKLWKRVETWIIISIIYSSAVIMDLHKFALEMSI